MNDNTQNKTQETEELQSLTTAEVPTEEQPPMQSRSLTSYWWVLLVIVAVVAVVVAVARRGRGRSNGGRSGQPHAASRGTPPPARQASGQSARNAPVRPQADKNQPVVPSTRIPQRVYPADAGSQTEPTEASSPETEIVSETEIVEPSRYTVGFAQTIGDRVDQEDSYAISNWRDSQVVQRQGLLAAVADGVGGLDDGQVASNTLMRCFCEEFNRLPDDMPAMEKLLELTARGQQEVLRINRAGKRCGTTLVALLIENGFLSTMSVGDSRIALYRAGALLQLNREHVLGRESDEQQALSKNGYTPDSYRRGAITSYIGMEGLRLMDRTLNPIRLVSGDRVLLMSDGVFGTLNDDEIIAFLDRKPENAAEEIIRAVEKKAKPHQDNATIVIVGLD